MEDLIEQIVTEGGSTVTITVNPHHSEKINATRYLIRCGLVQLSQYPNPMQSTIDAMVANDRIIECSTEYKGLMRIIHRSDSIHASLVQLRDMVCALNSEAVVTRS